MDHLMPLFSHLEILLIFLVQTQIQIRQEQENQLQLTQRLAEVQGTREWEQAEYNKDTAALQSIQASQQAKLDATRIKVAQETAKAA